MDSSDRSNNFEFAFNSGNFSDRVLRIEIVASANEFKDDEGSSGLSDSARYRKRRREDISKEKDAEYEVCNLDTVNCDQSDTNDCVAYENSDVEAAVMIESPTADRPLKSSCRTVKTMHINSAILASKSIFFYKLFSNGMQETDQKQATLRIRDTEETALMELLSFIYNGKLSIAEVPQILDVLKTADKFEVPYCIQYCTRLLRKKQITLESALLYSGTEGVVKSWLRPWLYLNLRCSISTVKPLIDSAKQFLSDKYGDISKFHDEVLNLPLAAIEAILRSDNLQVESEDEVFDFVLEWSRIHYPKVEERRKILGPLLCSLVRFPHMTCIKLDIILQCNDLDQEVVLKEVLEAFRFKAVPPHRQRALASVDVSASHKYVERTYKHRSVRVMEFLSPYHHCVVYLDLKKEDCANLYPGGNVRSQAFHLCSEDFFLSAHCNMDQQSSLFCFGLFLNMQGNAAVTFYVELEISVRIKHGCDFIRKHRERCRFTFTGDTTIGCRNLFEMDWDSFMADASPHFIKDVLYLRAEFTIKKSRF